MLLCTICHVSISIISLLTCSVLVQNLSWLDVSRNKLTTACLGLRPQLFGLETLILAGNDIMELKKDDFSFLNNSRAFRTLALTSLPLKKVRRNAAASWAHFHSLIVC